MNVCIMLPKKKKNVNASKKREENMSKKARNSIKNCPFRFSYLIFNYDFAAGRRRYGSLLSAPLFLRLIVPLFYIVILHTPTPPRCSRRSMAMRFLISHSQRTLQYIGFLENNASMIFEWNEFSGAHQAN